MRVRGCEGAGARGCEGTRVQGHEGTRVRGYKGTRACCVFVHLFVCAFVCLCFFVRLYAFVLRQTLNYQIQTHRAIHYVHQGHRGEDF